MLTLYTSGNLEISSKNSAMSRLEYNVHSGNVFKDNENDKHSEKNWCILTLRTADSII